MRSDKDLLAELKNIKVKFKALSQHDQDLYLAELEDVYLSDSDIGHDLAEILRDE